MVLSLELYITDLLSKFGSHIADTSRTYNTPFPEGLNLTPEDCPKVGSAEHDDMAIYRVAYMSLVGGLMWVANMVCAEIAFAVSQLARALSNPARSHWNGALLVLCYLQTSRRTLTFTPDSGRGLEVYVDASWLPRLFVQRRNVLFPRLPVRLVLEDTEVGVLVKRRGRIFRGHGLRT